MSDDNENYDKKNTNILEHSRNNSILPYSSIINSNVITGGLEYVMDGWLECECNKRDAERKYAQMNHYNQPVIDNYDVIISIIGGAKKMTNKNLLKEAVIKVANILKDYELDLGSLNSTKLLPNVTSAELFEFAESEIQQNDPSTLEEIYNDLIHLAKFLKIKIKKKPLILIKKITTTTIPTSDIQAITNLEKKMIPYMKKIEQNQIILINLLNAF
jgi:hypothetical protein